MTVRASLVAAGLLVVASLTGCTSSATSPSATPSTRTVTSTHSTAPVPEASYVPAPATSVPALPRSGKAPKGEKFAHCPYIAAGLDEDSHEEPDSIADLEGDRVGKSTLLRAYRPVGCRFYFAYSYGNTRHEAVADILPATFASAAAAHNAMVRTAEAGRSQQSAANFVPGVDGIQYQTRFFGPDDERDWAFVFAKGKIMVVVHTQQSDSPLNALLIGKAIVGKF